MPQAPAPSPFGRLQKFEQLFAGICLCRGRADSRREYGVLLDVRRQWASKLGATFGENFADLREPDFGLAFADHLATAAKPDLGFELFGNSKPLQQAFEVDAAQAAIAECNCLSLEQCLFECLGGAQVRLLRAFANRNTHARAGNVGARACGKLAARDEVVSGVDAKDGDIEGPAFVDLRRQRTGRAVFDLETVTGRFLKLRAELLNDRFQRV
jgi:hypothetical protein